MRVHSANELIDVAQVLGPDAATVVAEDIPCGVTDLAGRRLEQAQLIAAETTHMVLMRANDGSVVTDSSYLDIDGLTYFVDYRQDPRKPRPKMWTEIYCHVERQGN